MAIAYETGQASSQQDLLSKLSTFAQAQGWTQDEWDAGANKRLCMHKGTLYVQFRWDSVASTGCIAIYHSLGYNGAGTAPGNHLNDSGNGQTAANPITTHRRIWKLGDGPFTSYHFFANTNPDYLHVVLEAQSGIYRHVAVGNLNKLGTWTGGEYVTDVMWYETTTYAYDPGATYQAPLFDGLAYGEAANQDGTVHIEGLPGMAGASKWGVIGNGTTGTLGNDRGGNTRYSISGGVRAYLHDVLMAMCANPSNGFIPLGPIWVLYRNQVPTPNECHFLGWVPDIRIVNLRYLEPAEEFAIGAETWKVFPWVKKANLSQSGVAESKNLGFAYRKA